MVKYLFSLNQIKNKKYISDQSPLFHVYVNFIKSAYGHMIMF